MALWGTTDADESKPKWLSGTQQKEIHATASGWVVSAGSKLSGNGNLNAQEEVLVAKRQLATTLASADITDFSFVTSTFSFASGGNIDVKVHFNEKVSVTGTPQLTVVDDINANLVFDYQSGNGRNTLIFRKTLGTSDALIAVGDVLSIGTNAMSLNGGTIVDKNTAVSSSIANVSEIGTNAGTLTISA